MEIFQTMLHSWVITMIPKMTVMLVPKKENLQSVLQAVGAKFVLMKKRRQESCMFAQRIADVKFV